MIQLAAEGKLREPDVLKAQVRRMLADPKRANDEMKQLLQNHVKASIAPYKYPRSVVFTDALPKTETGKIQRFRLKS